MSEPGTPSDRPAEIRFDEWTLRRHPLELYRFGTRIRLQDRPLQILEELLTHPAELVTRERLIAQLWPKRIVEFDTALNAAVRRLRAALGDEAEAPRYIETIPRQGYRFIGTLASAGASEPAAAREATAHARPSGRRRWQLVVPAALVLLAAAGAIAWYLRSFELASRTPGSAPRSIVVLPFADLSAEQNQQYFSDGLTEEILNALAQSPQLRVIARTSSFSFKGQNVDIATVAAKLGVTHVLEGSVRRSGNELRITAQLVDASTSSHLWSQTYDRTLDDIFDVQRDIAASVASALRVTLVDQARASQPGNPQAYEHLLRAHFFFQRRAPGDVERARQYYQQALDIDPRFARAWAGLAGAYWIQVVSGDVPRETGLARLRDAAERALELDPSLPEAHLRMVNYLGATGDRAGARAHRNRAAQLDPNNTLLLGFLAGDAAEHGRWDEAIELQRRAAAADPLSVLNRTNLADFLFYAGRLDEAKIEAAKAQELDPYLPEAIVLGLILERRFDEALRLVENRDEGALRAQSLALIYYGLGRRTEADAALARLIASYGSSEPVRVAEVHAFRGEPDEAFKWLQTSARLWPEQLPPLRRLSPFLKSLHADARWESWAATTRE